MQNVGSVALATEFTSLHCDNDNTIVVASALSVSGDGKGGAFKWNASSTATEDNVIVFKVTGVTTGRWIRMPAVGYTSYYDASGLITQAVRRFIKVHTPSTSNGESIDISAAGFTAIMGANVMAIKNNGTANLSPNVAVKSYTTSAIVVNIVEGNAGTTTILGVTVLSGSPLVFADTTGLTLFVEVIGY